MEPQGRDIQYFGRLDLGLDENLEIQESRYNGVSSLEPDSLFFLNHYEMKGRHIVFARKARKNGGGKKELLGIEVGEIKSGGNGNGVSPQFEKFYEIDETDLEAVREDPEKYLDKVLSRLK